MEKISLDAALHLPTIDPAPARSSSGRGKSSDRFDEHLQRASSPPQEKGERTRTTSEAKHSASKPSDTLSQSATSNPDSRNEDAHDDDARCAANNTEDASAVVDTEKTGQPESSHDEDGAAQVADASGVAAAAAAAATAQNATQQVATQPTETSNAVAQPERIGALDDSADQSNGVPAKMPETGADAGFSTVDTPDITARQVTESVDVKAHALHAAATTQAKATLPQAKPDSAIESATATSANTNKPPMGTIAPAEGDAETGDKKRNVGKARLTASDDAKLDAAAATEAKAALPITTTSDSNGSQQNNLAADTSVPTTDMHAGDGQSTSAGTTASTHVVDAVGKANPAAQTPATNTPSAAQKILDAAPRTAASGGDNTSEVERARFVQRVSKAFQTASQRGEPLRLRLSPPELGSVRMEVSIRAGAMTAKLQAETPAAQSMLLDNLPALRERLAQHNIKIERFDVDLFGQQNEGSQQSPSDAFDRQASRTLPPAAARQRSSITTEEKPTPAASRRGAGPGQLNVII